MSEEQYKVHPTSAKGYGEGKSYFYNRVRPSYHPTVISHVRKAIGKSAPLNIVEIGAGSGIFTRNILNHPEWSSDIAAIKAVEPNDGMREIFADTVKDPRVTLFDGVFEKTGVEDGWADVILMATAFHWCLNYKDAITEFVRILKPDGVVACVWYDGDRDAAPFVGQLWGFDKYLEGAARHCHDNFYKDHWREVFKEPNYLANFSEPEEEVIKYASPYTLQSWTDFVMTGSWVAVLPDDQKEEVRDVVKGIIETGEGVHWVDKEKGIWAHPFKSQVVVFRRK